ncbi:hypothetical protein Amsp01_088590 [Amycolatopsis sp. NBRC 101858]|uniref:TetR/AcrR family transcriptional regulator n=1 Tax=Amycolatopsis sp. NBRC 101858 TaxID=3032200 RepID=UPI0024A0CDC6|nr:TetR/AcrR family transcriptional regulator [Amycolatopsis sp. NBRC 101858]GLY42836.1 hypothetical protein Amsp01_088590 [Amycolatopsis sp. NBRC 101858]
MSIERIAGAADVTRPQLYKYFDDTADLQRAIADRITELVVAALRSVWEPRGSPNHMIAMAVEAHTRWLAENGDLYRYATLHSQIGRRAGRGGVADVKTVIAKQAALVFEHYLTVFAIDARIAEPVAFGIVDVSTSRWLEKPRSVSRAGLAATLTDCTWRLLDGMFRVGGVRLDPTYRAHWMSVTRKWRAGWKVPACCRWTWPAAARGSSPRSASPPSTERPGPAQPPLPSIRTSVAVAEYGSIVRTARTLHSSQPAPSSLPPSNARRENDRSAAEEVASG